MALICHARSTAARYFMRGLSASTVIGRWNSPPIPFSRGGSDRCFGSARAGESVSPQYDDCRNQVLDFPGGKVAFIPEMRFLSESTGERISCYRVLDDNGQTISGSSFKEVTREVAVKMYRDMITLQVMDTIFYEAQRQGRISFYLTSTGEEAINIASAAALSNEDVVFPQFSTQ